MLQSRVSSRVGRVRLLPAVLACGGAVVSACEADAPPAAGDAWGDASDVGGVETPTPWIYPEADAETPLAPAPEVLEASASG